MTANCSCGGDEFAFLAAPGLLPAPVVVEGGLEGVKGAAREAAREEGGPVAVVAEVVPGAWKVSRGDAANKGEGNAPDRSVKGVPEGVAGTVCASGGAVTGLDAAADEVKSGLVVVCPAVSGGMPGLGGCGVVGLVVARRGKGGDCSDGGGSCIELGGGVAAGVLEVTGGGGKGGANMTVEGKA